MGGQKITGTLTEVTMLPIRTAFGEASVPLAEVAGVKLATAEEPSTTVIMPSFAVRYVPNHFARLESHTALGRATRGCWGLPPRRIISCPCGDLALRF